ncbi:MAG TPA: ornithine cyclodeaminase family protein [Acidimicrobiia bacterium]|jgi:ornithine cyclodeaminase/alanine dehydrogenase-like protein (mu-crystallin family)|nr:ornithine cyclodeaminase family protein [Acidimicrobiia bacterium]
MRILDAADVDQLIDDEMVLDAIRRLFSLPTGPEGIGLGRIDLTHPKGWLRSLPAFVAGEDLLGFKVLHRTSGVGMRYTIYVHRLSTGELIGVVDALEITNLRTGAVSALATDLLTPRNVGVAAIVGTGPVARGQLRALELVRPAAEVRVFARTPENRRAFVEDMSRFVSGILVDSPTLEDALQGAEMITLATKATAPVLLAEHLHRGVHVNSVGPASRDRVEVDPGIFDSFDRVVCDSASLVLDEAGDAYQAVSNHGFQPEHAEDLASLVAGITPGRKQPEEMTLFKSVGTGAQDLIVAAELLERAAAADLGTVVGDVNSIKPIAPGG